MLKPALVMGLAALPQILLARPLIAETGYTCVFTVECIAAGDCAPADRRAEIGISGEDTWIFLSETSGPLPAVRLSGHGPAQPFGALGTGPASALLTIEADGTALMSQHPGGGGAITYFGTCEAAR